MKLGWLEKQAWGRLQKKMPKLKRWLPLIGTANLVIIALLRVLGYHEQAQALSTLGGLFGLDGVSAVPAGEITSLVLSGAGIAAKVKAEVKKASATTAALLVLALTAAPGQAQEAKDLQPAPGVSAGALEVDLAGWTQAIVTRGEKREVAGGRVVVDYAITDRLRAFSRIDITGAQDFGSIEAFGQYEAFRAVETYGGLRYDLRRAGMAIAIVGGTSWSIEGADGPLDPRMATALALVRVPLPGGGHAYVGGGHRGPVGGAALVATVTYPAGPTRLIVDYDLPLTKLDGLPRPGVLKTGVAVPIWSLR